MTGAPSTAPRYFTPLEQMAFLRLAHAAYLKGLLKPFKGKGELEDWARRCEAMRDSVIALAEREVLAQVRGYPFTTLPVHLTQQVTGAGTTFLRWRNLDRSSMGVALWEGLVTAPTTPSALIDDLLALELHRIVLNMQVSLTHSIARQALECASKVAQAEVVYQRRVLGHANSLPMSRSTAKEFP